MKRPTQKDRVLRLLITYDVAGVTRLDAVREAGVMELASRIGELEAEGAKIERTRSRTRNRFGDPMTVTVYTLTHVPSALLLGMLERERNA